MAHLEGGGGDSLSINDEEKGELLVLSMYNDLISVRIHVGFKHNSIIRYNIIIKYTLNIFVLNLMLFFYFFLNKFVTQDGQF